MQNTDRYRIISMSEAMRLTNLSRSTLWRLQRAGRFPKRISLSPNRVGYLENDVIAWIAARAGA